MIDVVRTSGGVYEMPLEAVMFEKRVIYLEGEINRETVSEIEKELAVLLSKGEEDVLMVINSEGGSIRAGLSLLSTMNSLPFKIDVLVLGEAYSMAAVIFSCTNGRRYIGSEANLMFHEPLVVGNKRNSLSEVKETLDTLLKCKEKLVDMLEKRTGIDKKKLEKIMKEDHYYDKDAAISLGFADEVADLTLTTRYGGK